MNEQINIESIKEGLESCCKGDTECSTCQGKDCLIGFAKLVAEYAGAKRTLTIPNGLKMVPTTDFKVYDTDAVATGLAIINIECKNCMENHDDNCIVNIVRSSLEVSLFGQHIDFTGNSLAYIMQLSNINGENGNKVMQAYRALKK